MDEKTAARHRPTDAALAALGSEPGGNAQLGRTPQKMTVDAFVGVLAGHLDVMAIGLSASNPMIPGQIFAPALAAAMGRVLSAATASPDIAATLQMRKNCIEAFTDALRKAVPALQNVAAHSAS